MRNRYNVTSFPSLTAVASLATMDCILKLRTKANPFCLMLLSPRCFISPGRVTKTLSLGKSLSIGDVLLTAISQVLAVSSPQLRSLNKTGLRATSSASGWQVRHGTARRGSSLICSCVQRSPALSWANGYCRTRCNSSNGTSQFLYHRASQIFSCL